jgi:hypothetical protein
MANVYLQAAYYKPKMLCSLAVTHYTSHFANVKIFKHTRSKKYYYEKGLDITTCAVKINEHS